MDFQAPGILRAVFSTANGNAVQLSKIRDE